MRHVATADIDPPLVRAQVDAGLGYLRAVGRRRNEGRAAVLRVLAHAGGHLSVGQVRRELAAAGHPLDHSVVYRTLTEFSRVGLTHPLLVPGDPAYGLAYPPHAHAVCQGCGGVTEIALPHLVDAATAANNATDFDVQTTGIGLLGTCPACRAETAGTSAHGNAAGPVTLGALGW